MGRDSAALYLFNERIFARDLATFDSAGEGAALCGHDEDCAPEAEKRRLRKWRSREGPDPPCYYMGRQSKELFEDPNLCMAESGCGLESPKNLL